MGEVEGGWVSVFFLGEGRGWGRRGRKGEREGRKEGGKGESTICFLKDAINSTGAAAAGHFDVEFVVVVFGGHDGF